MASSETTAQERQAIVRVLLAQVSAAGQGDNEQGDVTLYGAGGVHSRNVSEALGRLALWADGEDLERVRQLRLSKRPWPKPRSPATLRTPQPREAGEC